MPSFDAAKATEPLDYNLAPYADAKGSVPEPTSDQVAQFYTDLQNNYELVLDAERLAGYDLSTPGDLMRLGATLTYDETRALYDHNLDTYAKVCSGKPSRDELAALPHRSRQAFYGAVAGWLRPEA